MPKYFHITYTGIYEGTAEDFLDKTDKVDDAVDEQFGNEWVGGANGDYDIEREFAHIIRCKDCVHCIPQGEDGDWFYCEVWWKQVRTDLKDYCSRAERKEHD